MDCAQGWNAKRSSFEETLPYHECTDADFAKFRPPAKRSRDALKKIDKTQIRVFSVLMSEMKISLSAETKKSQIGHQLK